MTTAGSKDTDNVEEESRERLVTHLKEVRARVVVSLVAVLVGFGACYPFAGYFFDLLTAPVLAVLPEGSAHLNYTGIVEPFFTYLKTAFIAALIFASPVVLYQVWAFVAPALYDNEKKIFFPLVFFSAILFYSGAYFAYGFIFPVGFEYLIKFAEGVVPVLTMKEYFAISTKLMIAFGAVFQIPLVILVLSVLGVVTWQMLLKWWRFALLGSVIFGALLTPPDVISQLLMAVPMMVLYFAGVLVAYMFGKKKE